MCKAVCADDPVVLTILIQGGLIQSQEKNPCSWIDISKIYFLSLSHEKARVQEMLPESINKRPVKWGALEDSLQVCTLGPG